MPQILLADDEPDMLQTLAQLLQASFPTCRILTASNGDDAHILAIRETPTLILADFKMPGADGFELARRLQRAGKTVPILLMTAFADSNLEARAKELPLVRGFFKKPIDPEALVEAIRNLLAQAPPT